MSEDKVVHTERVFVTAEMARRWLRQNIENNRPINHARVSEYARDMKNGKWKENGETIKFADTGELIDGQHRLQACMEGGIGFWSLVAYGVKKEASLTIDRNQVRSTAQMLHLTAGIGDYNSVSATITWLSRFREGIMLASYRPTTTEASELLTANPGIVDSVAYGRKVNHRFKTGPVPVVAICHYLFSRQDATLAEMFFDSLATGATLREIDPVYQLRSRIISANSSTSKRIGSYELLALFFKTWIAEREQRTIKTTLRWVSGESFPNIGPVGLAKVKLEAITTGQPTIKKGQRTSAGKRLVPKRPAKDLGDPKLNKLAEKLGGLDQR